MAAKHFTYTDPSRIEGEPPEVAKLAIQQTHSLAEVVAELSRATYIQLRAAGMDPDAEDAVDAWLNTKPGQAAADLIWAAQVFVEAVKAL